MWPTPSSSEPPSPGTNTRVRPRRKAQLLILMDLFLIKNLIFRIQQRTVFSELRVMKPSCVSQRGPERRLLCWDGGLGRAGSGAS